MTLRSLMIWGVIVVVLIALYSVLNQGAKTSGTTELSYTGLLQKVDQGQIKGAVISSDVIEAHDAANKTYVTYTPSNQDDLLKRLEAKGADIQVKRANQVTIWSVLFQSLPVILIIGAWIFLMRQMQGGARGAMGFGRFNRSSWLLGV